MANISKTDIEHVARLARLKLTEKEEEKLTQDLGEILNYVDELGSADTAEILAVSQISGLENVMREDQVTNGLNREKLLENAPEQKDGFLKVKQVFE